MKFIKIKNLLIASLILFQLMWYGMAVWQRMLHPDLYKQTDFSIFYTAGLIADTGRYDLIYDIKTQLVTRQEFLLVPLETTQLLPFNHPPLFVPLLQIIIDGNYLASYWRWVAVLFLFLMATMVVLNKLLQTEKLEAGQRWLFILTSVLFYPLFVSFFRGQDTVIVLLGVMIWMYGLVTDRDALSGTGLALAILRPQIALMLAFPFLFKRKKVWWWFFGVASLFAVYSLLLVGPNGVRDYLTMIGISAQGQGYEINQQAMLNFTGLILRLFPQVNLDILHLITWGLFCAALAGLAIWWKNSSEIGYRHIVLAVTISLFVAPHLHYHDLTLLLIPCLGVGLAAIRANRLKIGDFAGLLTLLSSALMISFLWLPIQNILPYLWMAIMIWVVWYWSYITC